MLHSDIMKITNEELYEHIYINNNIVVIPSSRMIKVYSYNTISNQLSIIFKPNIQDFYIYHNVKSDKFEELERAISKGKFVTHNIKKKHAYECIKGEKSP